MIAKNLEDIISWATHREKTDDVKWLFRGQSDSEPNWPLSSSIFRKGTRRDSSGHEIAYDPRTGPVKEKEMLDLFKKRALPYIYSEPKDEISWLALAQHHGLPTRLLDWTSNVLVAAFWACKAMRSGGKRKPVIYAIDAPKNFPEAQNVFDLPANEIFLFVPPVVSPRIAAQGGFFTVQNHDFDFASVGIRQKFIDQTFEGEIKRQLIRTGIDAHAIQPDIDGLANSIAWKYKWNLPIL